MALSIFSWNRSENILLAKLLEDEPGSRHIQIFQKVGKYRKCGSFPKNFYTRIYVVFYFFKTILISPHAYFLVILTIMARLSRYGYQGGG